MLAHHGQSQSSRGVGSRPGKLLGTMQLGAQVTGTYSVLTD
jgi:hypothetical protein